MKRYSGLIYEETRRVLNLVFFIQDAVTYTEDAKHALFRRLQILSHGRAFRRKNRNSEY